MASTSSTKAGHRLGRGIDATNSFIMQILDVKHNFNNVRFSCNANNCKCTNLGIFYFLIEFYFAYIVWLKIVRVPFVT